MNTVLVVVAHPDDAEFGVGGTIAKLANEGADVHVCVTTNGASGSSDPAMTRERLAAIRRVEQENASAALGAKEVVFLGHEDGYLTPSIELRKQIARLIRALRPELVITSDPSRWYAFDRYINHPDHRATGEACLAAIMPSADTRLVFPELLDEGLEPHRVDAVWLATPVEADHYIDITDTIDRKIEALRCHVSQVGEEGGFEQFVRERARLVGEAKGLAYAEAFKAFWFRRP
jgi:LmbE family N-acetylglucosaminyl deacetylase